MKKHRLLRISVVVLLAVIFGVSAYKTVSSFYEYEKSKRNNAAIVEENVTVIPPPSIETPEVPAETAPIAVDFENLLAENPDVIGWIYCADTPINYPVVQSADNDYYLRRGLDGQYDVGGTVFMDFRNHPGLQDLNTMIYGHNMKNDTMFGTFMNYKEQSYYEAHPVLWYLTPEKDYKLELIAGYVAADDADIYQGCETPEELQALLQTALSVSTFQSDIEVSALSRIFTLSTCSYEFEEARYVLLCAVEE